MRTPANTKGFTAVEVLLALIFVAIVGFAGYYVWHNQKSDKTAAATKSSSSVATTKGVSAQPPKSPILYSDGTSTLYDLAVLATTPDQKGQAAAVVAKCITYAKANNPSVNTAHITAWGGSKDYFTSSTNPDPSYGTYKQDGNFAFLAASCYDKSAPGADQIDGGSRYFVRKLNGSWSLMFAGQADPACNQVDGSGIPAGILAKCYDQALGAERAPK